MHKGTRRVLALIAVLALLVAACTSAPTDDPGPTGAGADVPDPEGELITVSSEPDTIDPHRASFVGEIAVILSVFEGLMALDPQTLEPVPASAAQMPEISADGRTWKFTLREGLKFSDGTPLVAADFARGFTRTCDPATRGDYAFVLYIVEGCQAWNEMDPTTATPTELEAARAALGISVLSDMELEFRLIEPAPYFAYIAYMWVGMPVKQESLDQGGSRWTEPATYIGNGPFKLVEWKHNDKFVFERNENFRLPVKLKRWTRLMINEGAVAFAAYRNNQLDLVGVAAEDLRTVESDPELSSQVVDGPDSCTFYISFNLNKPPFDDPKVRLAFAKSIDRQSWIDDIQKIGAPADGGFIPPGIPGHDPADDVQAFDVEAAKQLLAESRYANSPELANIRLTYAASAREATRIQFFQQQWRANLGIEVIPDPVDSTAYTQLVKSAATAPQLFDLGWCADFPDQQNWHTTVWISGAGISAGRTGYDNPEFDSLVRRADQEPDTATRDQMYLEAGRMLSNDAPAAWVFYSATKFLLKPWVKGLHVTPLGSHYELWNLYVTEKG